MTNKISRYAYWLVPLTWVLTVTFFSPLLSKRYSPDSFAYAMVGGNLLSGHGYTSLAVRESVNLLPFNSRAFPPLYPMLCGITDAVFHQGVASGLVLNLLLLWGVYFIWFLISFRLSETYAPLLYLACPLFICANLPFIDEILAARSIPLNFLLLETAIYIALTQNPLSRAASLLMGVILGGMYLTRFDSSLFIAFMPLLFLKKERLRNIALIYLGIALIVSPWLMRNFLTFGTPFASNQTVTVFSLFPGHPLGGLPPPLTYLSKGIALASSNPHLWFAQREAYLLYNVLKLYGFLQPEGHIILLLFGACIFYCRQNRPVFLLTCSSLLWITLNLCILSLTGYTDDRYYSMSVFLIELCALAGVVLFFENMLKRRLLVREPRALFVDSSESGGFLLTSAVLCITLICHFWGEITQDVSTDHMQADLRSYKGVTRQVRQRISDDDLVGYMEADKLSYFGGIKTVQLPWNLNNFDENFFSWREKFAVRFLLVKENAGFVKEAPASSMTRIGSEVLIDTSQIKPLPAPRVPHASQL